MGFSELVHVRHGGWGGRGECVVILCALGVGDHGEHVVALLGCERRVPVGVLIMVERRVKVEGWCCCIGRCSIGGVHALYHAHHLVRIRHRLQHIWCGCIVLDLRTGRGRIRRLRASWSLAGYSRI